jgi:hypothetical protein
MMLSYLLSKYLPSFVERYDYRIAPPADPDMKEVSAQ